MRSRLVFVPRLSRTTLCGRVAFAAMLHRSAMLGSPHPRRLDAFEGTGLLPVRRRGEHEEEGGGVHGACACFGPVRNRDPKRPKRPLSLWGLILSTTVPHKEYQAISEFLLAHPRLPTIIL